MPVREVESVMGGIVTLNADPSPDGTFIPWAADRPTGLAQAREITIPIPGEVRWAKHECG
jgi:hypothetical protein